MKKLLILLALLLPAPALADWTISWQNGATPTGYTLTATEAECKLLSEIDWIPDTQISVAPDINQHTYADDGTIMPDGDGQCRARHTWVHDSSQRVGETPWAVSAVVPFIGGSVGKPGAPNIQIIISISTTLN